MKLSYARLLIGLSLILLLFVSLAFDQLKIKERKSERKVTTTETTTESGKVLAGGPCSGAPRFTIINNVISPTQQTAEEVEGGIVFNEQTYNYLVCFSNYDTHVQPVVTNSWPSDSSLDNPILAGYGVEVGSSLSAAAFKSSGTYTFYLSNNPSLTGTIVVGTGVNSNSPTVTTQTSPTSSTKKTTTTTTATAQTTETIKNVTLPSVFGTGSTKLADISDPAKVENLILDSSVGSIKFNETVDLSSDEVKNKFKELDKYIKVAQKGVISIDSTNLPQLNKKATLTMKALNFVKTPRVLYNGKENKSVISNIKYKEGTLTFDVSKFSTFTAAPNIEIEEPENNFSTSEKTVKLKGKVNDPTASVSAKLNNKNLGKVKVATNGSFEKEVNLDEGNNNLVVSALSSNLATAEASVSGTLKKTNLAVLYALLGFLAIIGGGGLIYSLRKLKKGKEANPNQPDLTSASPPAKI